DAPGRRSLQLMNFDCMDCDSGDLVDRFSFESSPPGMDTLYGGFFYDWAGIGGVTYNDGFTGTLGRELAQLDDTNQWGLSLARQYRSVDERSDRAAILNEQNRPVLEAGFQLIRRTHSASIQSAEGLGALGGPASGAVLRDAQMWIPDLWVRMLWIPAYQHSLRLELEAVAIFGDIRHVGSETPETSAELQSRDIQQFGLAFESEYRYRQLVTGLNAGFATGRDVSGEDAAERTGWGVQDIGAVAGTGGDPNVTAFGFDPSYIVDMTMFREIIGTVTNAIYINPYIQYDFFKAQANSIGFRLDGVYGTALNADATPGGDSSIGLELATMLYYTAPNYRAGVNYAVLFPFGALDAVEGRSRIPDVAEFYEFDPNFLESADATIAHTLQFHLMWAF
ncbi:MAG: hypothetical protein KC561_15430, partial [Myxococcales bacterium]|nr:hypothetical protein [Myxococcales bacterium]